MKLEDGNNRAKQLLLIISNNWAKQGVAGESQAEGIEQPRWVRREEAEKAGVARAEKRGPRRPAFTDNVNVMKAAGRGRRLLI